MLRELELREFKCFKRQVLPLAELTLLSGSNASGKSSALQALVLLHQTIREHEWSTRLLLNGESLRLGTVLDVVDKVHGRKGFSLDLEDDSLRLCWRFSGERGDMSMEVETITIGEETVERPPALRHLLPPDRYDDGEQIVTRLRDLTYLTAERVGPRETYPLEDRQTARVVGPRGEHAVSVLYRMRADQLSSPLVIDGVAPTGLKQVEARMRTFFPGCRLDVQQVAQANAVTLGIRTSDDTDFHRPIHVGFGLTQVLPLVVAALAGHPGDLLLIENPEVHLHPAGQALMGHFLAEVAASGVQVVVETHSDHVLNGIRRAVKGGVLPADHTALHFFRPRDGALDQVVSPNLDAAGNIDVWPDGFFDQFDKDMNHFAGWE